MKMQRVYGDLREKKFFVKNILGAYELEIELKAAWAEYEMIQRELSNFGDSFSRAENRKFDGKLNQLKAIESYIRIVIETLKKKYRYTQEEIDDILFDDCSGYEEELIFGKAF